MRRLCACTMSLRVMIGKERAYGFPVAGWMEEGPVLPWHPPRTFEQITKNLSVSNALPGPIVLSHQPGLRSSAEYFPAACESPESACRMRRAFVLSRLSLPYVS